MLRRRRDDEAHPRLENGGARNVQVQVHRRRLHVSVPTAAIFVGLLDVCPLDCVLLPGWGPHPTMHPTMHPTVRLARTEVSRWTEDARTKANLVC